MLPQGESRTLCRAVNSGTMNTPSVSIVIPTKNAGSEFDQVLGMLSKQELDVTPEIVVVDSGSEDETKEICHRYPVQFHQIDPAEFGHGRTRNLGVSLSTGDIVCLLTQDALPSDPHIIRNLIRHFERDDVAGVVGRQIPRPDASLLTTLSVNNWVLASPEVHVSQITSQDTFEQSSPYEQYLACVFDNVCSAIRRSVWERIPFPDVVFSEDLEWGYRVLRSGYAIVYEPDAAVYHSHDRPIVYQFHRTRIDHYRLAELFGLETVPTVFHIPGSIMHQILGEARALARMNAPFWRRFRETLKLPARAVAHVFAQYTGARAYRMGQPPEDLKAV